MKILLIEDDESLADLVIKKLTLQKQHIIEWSDNGFEGLELAQSSEYDLILLDVALPQLNGIEVCQQLREHGNQTPILLLTAHDTITQKVAGFDAGADDYLVKPFDYRELLARVRALSRRGNDNLLPVLQWSGLTLDPNNCQVSYRGKPLKLTAKEYSLLELFLRNPHRIFSQTSLIEKIWSWEESPSENAVRTQIKGLRHKLRKAGSDPNMIETVYGLGYRLKEIVAEASNHNQLATTEPLSSTTPLSQSNMDSSDNLSLNGIWQKYRSQYQERVILLQKTIKSMQENKSNTELKQQAIASTHTLVGSLGSFGFTESSQICSQIKTILQSHDKINHEAILYINQLLDKLLGQINSPPKITPIPISDSMTFGNDEIDLSHSSRYELLIVDDDFPLAQALVSEAITWGIDAKVAGNISQAREAISQKLPDAILLDLSFPEANNGGLELLQELANQNIKIPVIALTARESFADRIKVARLGGKGFLTKPLSPTQAMETVSSILEQSNLPDAKVLVVDNQQDNLNTISRILQPWGFEIITLQDAKQFWDVLEHSNPDIIIAQLETEGVSGVEICQVVRNDPRWCHLPVILISSHEDIETIQQICSVGVDDHLSFPIVEEELLARIFNRLDKERYRRQLADTDPLTGVSNRRASLKRLTRLLRISQRQQKHWCFVVIDLDNFKQINDKFLHESGDLVLRRMGQSLKQEFRSEDVIARWGGEEFVLGLYDMNKEAAVSRLQSFLASFRQQEFQSRNQEGSSLTFQVTFSAGVAEYPVDGKNLETLYQSADIALYKAKKAGKNQIK